MAGDMDEKMAPRDGDPKRPKIRFTRPPPVPVDSRGYAVFNLDGDPQQVRSSWRATVQAYRLWCFNSSPDRYQFGHSHRRSCMLPLHGHFLVYIHFNGKWLCAVIHGPSGYLDGYITQSTGDNLRVRENRPSGVDDDAKGPVYIQNADLLPWDGGYVYASGCHLGYLGCITSFKKMFKSVHGIVPEPKYEEVTFAGETLILHLAEAPRSDDLYFIINSNFIKGCELGTKLLGGARNWRVKCEKPLAIMEEVYSAQPADKRNPKRKANANKRAGIADKKGKVADEEPKFADKENKKISGKGAKLAEVVDEEEFGIGLNEELTILEDIRLFHRLNHTREMFQLNNLPVHLVNGRPENNDLDKYLKPQKPNTDSIFLVKPFRRFVRSYRKKEKDEEKISICLEKTTSDMKELCADFIADLNKSSKESHNAGIRNLGSTCYASSSLQCLYSIGEIKSALYSYPENGQGDVANQTFHNLTCATKNIFDELDQSKIPIHPVRFIETLREACPQFDEMEGGTHRQQDAEEFWSLLVTTLSETLLTSDPAARPIKELFAIELLKRTKKNYGAEIDDETMSTEKTYNLKCHMYGHVKQLRDGLELDLKSEHETEPTTGQKVRYTTESTINKLPCYLVIQFGRVRHKEGEETLKVTDEVPYPLDLDLYEFCSDELKQKLQTYQQGSIVAENAGGISLDGPVESSSRDGSSATSMYELVAVVTHDGPTPNLGHYLAWVKQEGGYWIQYDDATVTKHKEDDVLKLCGGGEGQMAYICLYKARRQ